VTALVGGRSSGAGGGTAPGRRRFGVRDLPDFPWDTIADARATASAHPDGIVDLSVGTPVDDTPLVIREALAAAANAPGYPTTTGPESLRAAIVEYLAATAASIPLSTQQVLPTIGSKELVATLPSQLALGPADTMVVPTLAYPTYAVGAVLAGCRVIATDRPQDRDDSSVAMVWVNSPANPSGRVTPPEELAEILMWARENDVLLVSDECYLPFAFTSPATSVLSPEVNGGTTDHLLAVHSLSKRSNLAGYRAGFVAGDQSVVDALLAVRKQCGFLVPAPVQAAMAVALGDQGHVAEQKARYAARRDVLAPALRAAGLTLDHSEGALYLWCTRGEGSADTVAWFADRGILVAPGTFYGVAGSRHVRVALTASDERIESAARRLHEPS
jgi:succinyldiaminopimelate transaminase